VSHPAYLGIKLVRDLFQPRRDWIAIRRDGKATDAGGLFLHVLYRVR
jgi:hypothetical protein